MLRVVLSRIIGALEFAGIALKNNLKGKEQIIPKTRTFLPDKT